MTIIPSIDGKYDDEGEGVISASFRKLGRAFGIRETPYRETFDRINTMSYVKFHGQYPLPYDVTEYVEHLRDAISGDIALELAVFARHRRESDERMAFIPKWKEQCALREFKMDEVIEVGIPNYSDGDENWNPPLGWRLANSISPNGISYTDVFYQGVNKLKCIEPFDLDVYVRTLLITVSQYSRKSVKVSVLSPAGTLDGSEDVNVAYGVVIDRIASHNFQELLDVMEKSAKKSDGLRDIHNAFDAEVCNLLINFWKHLAGVELIVHYELGIELGLQKYLDEKFAISRYA